MKLLIEEYGRVIIVVLLGMLLFFFINGTVLKQVKSHIVFPDSIEKENNKQSDFYRMPELKGLEKDGRPLALKIQAGSEFHPVNTEGIIQVKAVDSYDGDITNRIKVYMIRVKDKKETKTLIEGNLDTSESNRQYILEYVVKNSAGYQSAKRISVLTDGTGGKL
ncbi:MAG: hypothetical protein Q4E73_07425 [Lachnospiraceae bacterium]|nr:hypothetical protein [Lachnospiraceae bacterium]